MPNVINDSRVALSNSVMLMLAITGPSDEPVETPSFCLEITPLKENVVLAKQSLIRFLMCSLVTLCWLAFLFNLLQYNTDSLFKETFINNDVTSKEKYR